MQRFILTISIYFFIGCGLFAQTPNSEEMKDSLCLLSPPEKYTRLTDSLNKTPIWEGDQIFIKGYYMDNFLDFRLRKTPNIPDSVKFIEFDYYRNSKEVLLPDSISKYYSRLDAKVSRWPKDKPLPGFYLIEKNGNDFIRKLNAYTYDTVRNVYLYDSLYYFDRYSLVYFDYKEKYRISGNIPYDYRGKWKDYLCHSTLKVLAARLAMYGIEKTPQYWDNVATPEGIRYIYYTAMAYEINKFRPVLIRALSDYQSYNYDIIFFSADKYFTADDNPDNIYEIVFSTKILDPVTKEYLYEPRNFESFYPQRRLVGNCDEMGDIDAYLRNYLKTTYNLRRYSLNIFQRVNREDLK